MRVVVDTNVLFEGLTKTNSASGFILKLWRHDYFKVCVSTSLAIEYVAIIHRLLSPRRQIQAQLILSQLLQVSSYTSIHYTWRPSSPDPGDDHIIDCAMNSGAIIVTHNVKDFRLAAVDLGLKIFRPVEFIQLVLEQNNGTV